MFKGYKRVVDNKMRSWGDIDEEKKIIRIRKKAGEDQVIGHIKNRPGNVLDTIVHEEMHIDHPKMHEYTVRRRTKEKIKKLSKAEKARFYAMY